jgi:hypothetical protein
MQCICFCYIVWSVLQMQYYSNNAEGAVPFLPTVYLYCHGFL